VEVVVDITAMQLREDHMGLFKRPEKEAVAVAQKEETPTPVGVILTVTVVTPEVATCNTVNLTNAWPKADSLLCPTPTT